MKTNRIGKQLWKPMLIVVILMAAVFSVLADPSGTTISNNSTDPGATITPDNRTDPGGTITTMQLDATQQNQQWKAYIGNMTGTLTLDDSNSQTIFSWDLPASSITGEVYASRTNSISWGDVNCSEQSIIDTEHTALGISSGAVDSINATFNETTHNAIITGGRTIAANTCPATAAFESDTRPSQAAANFQQVLFDDDVSLIYVTPITQDTTSYDGASTVDFQMILADDPTIAATTYYFFAEISG